jgi:hypothetical protein
VVGAQADVGAGREASQEECAQRSPSQNPAPHSLIPFRLRTNNKREFQHIAVVQPQRGPEMVVTHNFHLLRRILGLITLEHHPAVAPGYEHLTTADAGTVGCMISPDIPAQSSLRRVPR